MFDLFKRNKEPLHITRQTVFDNGSIPFAALDKYLDRRIAALETSSGYNERRVNDLIDIHKDEIAVHRANKAAQQACADAKRAMRIKTGTVDAEELNAVNVGNHGYTSDEFGVYARQVGNAFAKSQMGPGTETEGWKHWGSDRPEAVVPLDAETLDRIGKSVSVRTVYTSKESPKIRNIGDLWFVMSEDADGRDVAKSLKEWDGWMWVPVMGD